jgi:hypothetical protein
MTVLWYLPLPILLVAALLGMLYALGGGKRPILGVLIAIPFVVYLFVVAGADKQRIGDEVRDCAASGGIHRVYGRVYCWQPD